MDSSQWTSRLVSCPEGHHPGFGAQPAAELVVASRAPPWVTSRQGYVDTSPHSEGLGDRGGGFRLEGSPPRRVSPSDRAAVKVRPAVGVEVVLRRFGEPARWIDGERFGVGESLEPAGEVGGGGGWVEWTVFEGDG